MVKMSSAVKTGMCNFEEGGLRATCFGEKLQQTSLRSNGHTSSDKFMKNSFARALEAFRALQK